MFNKVAIIGVGLLGGSFAKALRDHGLVEQIVGVCRRPEKAQLAIEQGVIDDAVKTAFEAVEGADLVLLATPLLSMRGILSEIESAVKPDCMVMDVGSVKQPLVDLVQEQFSGMLRQFVFAHPIAGGEQSGVEASRVDLFFNKHLILTDVEHADGAMISRATELWQKLGSKVEVMKASEHDHLFAFTSHLPHVIAYSLVKNLHEQPNNKQLFALASAGFYDFTRIASSDPTMWRDICLTNRDEILQSIEQFSLQLQTLSQAIDQGDKDGLQAFFGDAKTARDEGLIAKK